jgi:lactoylglutathione lyase
VSIRDVWHTSFTVSDLDRSVRFYTELLGLELRAQQEQDNAYTRRLVGHPDAHLRVAQLALPGGRSPRSDHVVELVQYLAPAGRSLELATPNVGVAHLAFEVDDLQPIHDRLARAGVKFVSDPVDIAEGVNRGGRTVYLRDPDGITLELVQPPPHPS